MQVENDRHFRVNGAGASPLIDWNQNGEIDFDEFATTAGSLFVGLDKDMDGKLGPKRASAGPTWPGTPAAHGSAARRPGTLAKVNWTGFPRADQVM